MEAFNLRSNMIFFFFFLLKKGNLEMLCKSHGRKSSWGAFSIARVRYDEDSQWQGRWGMEVLEVCAQTLMTGRGVAWD